MPRGRNDNDVMVPETVADPANAGIDSIHGDYGLKDVVADEAFMQEPVDIRLMPTTDVNAPPTACVSVNGVTAWIPRNRTVRVRRAHVEVLARMKESRYTQEEVTPQNPGGRLIESVGLVYPFTVIRDANPRGGAWLERILMEAA